MNALTITRTPVESSNIASIGWEKDVGGVIEFKSGGVYRYPDMTLETFEDMKKAESVGRFFHAFVKPYAFEKLT